MSPELHSFTIIYGSRREKGLVRQENQDQIISFDSSVFGQVFLLADGMGGHENGAIAANMAITGFKQHFQALAAKHSLRECLEEATRLTNFDIYEKGNENGGPNARMGSTLVVCVVSAGSYVVAHAGDSRCYVFRGGVLIRLTRDHTAVQKMVDAGILSPEDAKNHPDASVLTRAFGQRPKIELEISEPFSLSPNETLLMCSDGLYGYVDEAVITEKLRQNHDPQVAADALLQAALDVGGHDNISIFVIRAEPSAVNGITAPDFPVEAESATPPAEPALPAVARDAVPAAAAIQHAAPPQTPPQVPAQTPPQTPAKAAAKAPAPAQSNNGGSWLRLASWLIAIAILLLAGPLIAYLRPGIVPVAVREKLAGWGIQLPASGSSAVTRSDSGGTGSAAPAIPRDSTPFPQEERAATAASGSVQGSAALAEPVVKPAVQPPAPSSGQSPAPSSAPAPTGKPRVYMVYPRQSTPVFVHEIDAWAAKIGKAGYQVTKKPVDDASKVWHMVAANPNPEYLSAIFLSGMEQDAVDICSHVSCSKPAAIVPAGEIAVFRENFGSDGIAVFAYLRSPPAKPEE